MKTQKDILAAFKAEIPAHLFAQMEKAKDEEEARNILPARYRPLFDAFVKAMEASDISAMNEDADDMSDDGDDTARIENMRPLADDEVSPPRPDAPAGDV